jgi:hypothetical protein
MIECRAVLYRYSIYYDTVMAAEIGNCSRIVGGNLQARVFSGDSIIINLKIAIGAPADNVGPFVESLSFGSNILIMTSFFLFYSFID